MAAIAETWYGIEGEPVIHIKNEKLEKTESGLELTYDIWCDPAFGRMTEDAAIYALRFCNLLWCEWTG